MQAALLKGSSAMQEISTGQQSPQTSQQPYEPTQKVFTQYENPYLDNPLPPPPPQKPRRTITNRWLIIGLIAAGLAVGIVGASIILALMPRTVTLPATQPTQQVTTQPAPTLASTETPQPTPTLAPQPTQAATPSPIPTIAPISLSGIGQQASQKFQLQEGLAIFKLTLNATSFFMVNLLDSNGKIVGNLVNGVGSFDGSTALGIQSAGTYLLNIQADGKWTVTIQQPRPTTAPYTTSFSGKGHTATQLFSMQSGLKIIKMTHDGRLNFIVRILDSNGNLISILVNVIGKFDGNTAVGIQADGIYLFDVQADGNWTISIQ